MAIRCLILVSVWYEVIADKMSIAYSYGIYFATCHYKMFTKLWLVIYFATSFTSDNFNSLGITQANLFDIVIS